MLRGSKRVSFLPPGIAISQRAASKHCTLALYHTQPPLSGVCAAAQRRLLAWPLPYTPCSYMSYRQHGGGGATSHTQPPYLALRDSGTPLLLQHCNAMFDHHQNMVLSRRRLRRARKVAKAVDSAGWCCFYHRRDSTHLLLH